jgi:nucleotide-binding universal stress UspA family protein
MFTKIVVPLDGTPEAEAALEPAVNLSRSLNATLYLLRVAYPQVPISYPELVVDYGDYYASELNSEYKQKNEEAYHYLDRLQANMLDKGLNCIKAVQVGKPSEEIVKYAQQIEASMLVMATHARSMLGKFFLGSVAEEVLRHSNVPVLMIHAATPDNKDTAKTENKHGRFTVIR